MELIVKLTGEVTDSNLDEYKAEIIKDIDAINTDLTTDDHFATAVADAKRCVKAREAISIAKSAALTQTKSIDALFRTMAEIDNLLQKKESSLAKKIKTKKTELKDDIVKKAVESLNLQISTSDHHAVANRKYAVKRDLIILAVKGKKTITTIQAAADAEVDNQFEKFKIFNAAVVDCAKILEPVALKHPTLFIDEDNLLLLSPEALTEIIKSRILARKLEDEKKAENKQEPSADDRNIKTEPATPPLKSLGATDTSMVASHTAEPLKEAELIEGFAVLVKLKCSKASAIKIAEQITRDFEEVSKVVDITLSRS